MKNTNEMTDAQVIKWMDKTVASTTAAVRYNNMQRKYELVDRHAELKDEMVKRDIWNNYCADNGYCPSHDGWDCMA